MNKHKKQDRHEGKEYSFVYAVLRHSLSSILTEGFVKATFCPPVEESQGSHG
jgi:hypothetical protein